MKKIFLVFLIFASTPVMGQSVTPSDQTAKRIIAVLQQQRNEQADLTANAMATVQKLNDDNKVLADRIVELQKRLEK